MNVLNTIVSTLKPENQANVAQADGGDHSSSQDTPWLLSSAARGIGSIAGAVSCLCGFFLLLNILNVTCVFSGALLIVEGFLMLLTEAPCCCVCLDFAYMPSAILNRRPAWIKATLYLFFAAVPFFWCTGVSTFFSSGLIMATSALYLLMALGKKADREEMAKSAMAQQQQQQQQPSGAISSAPTSVLVQNEELPVASLGPSGPGGNVRVLY